MVRKNTGRAVKEYKNMSDKESLNDKKRISEKRELSHSELKTIERFNKKRTLEPVSE